MRVVALAWIATAVLLAAAVPAQAAFPGSNGLIAFERSNGAVDPDFEIYNTAAGPLTANSVDDTTPTYSPDGTKIAFVRGDGAGRNIWMMDANGANQVQRTSAAGPDLDPTWSSDGTQIAYSAQGTLDKDIFVVNADGTGTPTPLITDAGDEITPAWSPDGTKIAFESQRDGNADIWVKTLAGGSASNLTNTPPPPAMPPPPGVSNRDPTWSPDGTKLAFMRDAGDTEIYTMDADGGNQTNLTAGASGADGHPAFSPDGSQIVWSSSRSGNPELWRASSGGGAAAQVTDVTGASSDTPDWQPIVSGGGGGGGGGGTGGGTGGGGGGVPEAEGGGPPTPQPGCPARVTFGEIEALASCFTHHGEDWTSTGRVRLNGLDIVPLLHTKIDVNPSERTVTSRGQVRVFAGESLLYEGTLSWKFSGGRVEFDAARDGVIHALPIQGTVSLATAGRGVFRATVYPRLDPIFARFFDAMAATEREHIPFRIPTITGDLTFRSENAVGVRFDGLHVEVRALAVGTFELRQLRLSFDGANDEWDGSLDLVLPGPEPRFQIQAELTIRAGAFARARAGVDGINTHIGYGVFLQRLGFEARANPLFFEGSIGLSGGPKIPQKPPEPPIEAISIDGAFSYLFADPGRLRASGKVRFAKLPMQGTAALEYYTTGRITFVGDTRVGLTPDFGVTSHLAGFVDANRTFLFEGRVTASLFGYGFSGNGLASNLGIAACGSVFSGGVKGAPTGRVGFGYRWNGALVIMGQSCDVGPYSPLAKSGSARAVGAQAGQVASVRLPAHLPVATFAVTGTTAPPRVTIVGPGGRRATTPADPANAKQGDFLILQRPSDRTTYIAVSRPAAGTWRLLLEPGSSPVSSVRKANGLPAPRVRAKVTGRGHRRKLRFRIRPLRGQVVRFLEEGPQTDRQLGRTKAGRGTIRFQPGDGKAGTRSIVAVVEQNGLPRTRLRVARYRAPRPLKPARPKHVTLRRRGNRLSIKWSRSRGAARYLVQVRTSDGRRLQLPTRRRSIRLAAFGRRESARVKVRGVRGPYLGRPANARLAPRKTRHGNRKGRTR